MLGVFDSGRGGLGALGELRRLCPDADLTYMADTAHLPYGDKSAEVLIPLIDDAVYRLHTLGCERVLLACVTASSLADRLSPLSRRLSYPIVRAVADAASTASATGRVGLLATDRTVREGVLYRSLSAVGVPPVSVSVGRGLVELAEAGRTDPEDTEALDTVCRALLPHLSAGIDTLVLGCTHYPALTPLFRRLLPDTVVLIPSGEVGARAFVGALTPRDTAGTGITRFYDGTHLQTNL